VEQYKENLRNLYREGKLTHQQLEEQLCHVVDSVNEEIRQITTEVLTEEDSVINTAGVRDAIERGNRSNNRLSAGKNASGHWRAVEQLLSVAQ